MYKQESSEFKKDTDINNVDIKLNEYQTNSLKKMFKYIDFIKRINFIALQSSKHIEENREILKNLYTQNAVIFCLKSIGNAVLNASKTINESINIPSYWRICISLRNKLIHKNILNKINSEIQLNLIVSICIRIRQIEKYFRDNIDNNNTFIAEDKVFKVFKDIKKLNIFLARREIGNQKYHIIGIRSCINEIIKILKDSIENLNLEEVKFYSKRFEEYPKFLKEKNEIIYLAVHNYLDLIYKIVKLDKNQEDIILKKEVKDILIKYDKDIKLIFESLGDVRNRTIHENEIISDNDLLGALDNIVKLKRTAFSDKNFNSLIEKVSKIDQNVKNYQGHTFFNNNNSNNNNNSDDRNETKNLEI